jgi:flagellar hook-length control protein FliK
MIARILASTSQAKELVESQLTNLKHTFLAQNISVEKIEVSTQPQYQTERNLQRENEQHGQQSGRQQKEQNNQESNEDVSFTTTLLDELVNIKV